MYVPPYFDDSSPEEIRSFVDKNSFATLVNTTKGRLWATHIPLEWEKREENDFLIGHISKGNRQWKGFNENADVLAIFLGAHSYVSSAWYDHENVPTWNYAAVHIYGTLRTIEGKELHDSLNQLMTKYEHLAKSHLKLDDLSKPFLDQEIKGIVGFEIKISEVQAAFKMSQNRNYQSYHSIIDHLSKSENHDAHEVSEIMKKRRIKD
jgi:transcriptional regulator